MRYYALILLSLSLQHTQAQDHQIKTLDSLLLGANYDAVIKAADAIQPNDAYSEIQVDYRKAQALIRSGKLDEAGKLLTNLNANTESLSANKDDAVALVSSALGSLLMNQGRNDLALEALQTSLESFERGGMSTSLDAADAIATLGIVYNSTGKTQQAEEQLLRAYSLRQEQLPENHELIAASLNDLGLVYSSTDPDKALDYYDKALNVYEKIHGHTHPKIAIAHTNLGFAYGQIELYGDAINSLEIALEIWEKVYPQPHPSKAFVLRNLGQTYSDMRNVEAAEGYFDRALKMYEDSYGEKHPDLASTLNAMGNIKVSQNKYEEGLALFQRALVANITDFNSLEVTVNPTTENFYNGNVLLYSLLYKAEAYESRYYGETLKFQDLLLSLDALQKCDTLIENLRQQINNESDKIALGVLANEAYADGVRVAHTLAENAWKKKPYRDLAFYFAEKSKSAVLQDAISDSNAKSFAGIPAEMLEEEKYLKALAAYCTQKLAQKPTPDEEKSFRDILFQVNRDYQTYIRNLEQKFPEYFNLKFNSTAPTIAQIQSKLDGKTTVLSYFLDEKNLRLYTFVITHKSYRIIDTEVPSNFDKQITGLRNALFYNEINTYKTTAQELSNLLIPLLPARIKNLVIIPTGRLGVIPFEALLIHSSKYSDSYDQLPYLLKRYTVNYEFSAGLILQKNSEERQLTSPSILLCAPVEFDRNTNLAGLPGTETEVEEISQLFESKNLKNTSLIKTKADEDQIKSGAIQDYQILHFATHGIVDEENPELSRIFLTQGESEDGNLFSGEIYNLKLNANLVTLSACETGLGKISKGEGVIGLSRALVYAGARYIIVSLWSVADASTSQLMTDFYDYLLQENHPDFSSALQAAKQKMIAGGKYEAPYYWAPFVIIGY
jgi:CHAT domain-containing protein